ncbi:hypothetical protein [Saccharopolyspora sp. NPDC002376]
MKKDMNHFYSAFGNRLVEISHCRRGVEISVTELGRDGEHVMSAVISREDFQQLIIDAPEILEAVDELRDEAMRKRGYPL